MMTARLAKSAGGHDKNICHRGPLPFLFTSYWDSDKIFGKNEVGCEVESNIDYIERFFCSYIVQKFNRNALKDVLINSRTQYSICNQQLDAMFFWSPLENTRLLDMSIKN